MYKSTFILWIIIISLFAFTAASSAQYSGGSGTQDDPYQISTVADWQKLMNITDDWNKHFVLMNDLDLQGVTILPVGSYSQPFNGVFDGTGHIIHNAAIQAFGGDGGLFGYVAQKGKINNLGIQDITVISIFYVGGLVGHNSGSLINCYASGSIIGNSENVGGLVGYNDSGSITFCHVTGSVNGRGNSAGGIIGYNDKGNIIDCYVIGSVIGRGGPVGGLVGCNYKGTITACYASGSVTGTRDVGGLVGYNDSGSLTVCYATGSIRGTSEVGGLVGVNLSGIINACNNTGDVVGVSNVGGLVGWNDSGIINACYTTGSVTGSRDYVGGLVGWNYSGSFRACCATGSVTGGSIVGGLVGRNSGSLTVCYATGSASGSIDVGGLVGVNWFGIINTCYAAGSVSGGSHVSGLVAYNPDGGIVNACFWDVETSGQTTSAGGTGKTTAEMKTLSTFTSAGWDFVGEIANGTEDTWSICEGTNYPRLTWQIPTADWLCPDGVGLEDFSYLAQFWMTPEAGNIPADLDKNNAVGITDLVIFCEQWLRGR